jgi:hypothetical protein
MFWKKESKCELCDTKQTIKNLESKLESLQYQLDKTYIKDVLKSIYCGCGFNLMELVEKDNVKEIHVYEPEFADNSLFPYLKTNKTIIFREETCISIRDFLLKNFPLEEKIGG